MSETKRILDQLHRSYYGPAWSGPAVVELLRGVTAAQAAATPIAGGHSIWELLQHISAWEDVARRRVNGQRIVSLPPEQDYPPLGETVEANWKKARAHAEQVHMTLEECVGLLRDGRLEEVVEGEEKHSIYALLHGVIQHNLYHAGQMALLKKAIPQ
jgi:uncharacterized damage-inducible protein DinB